MHLAVLLVHPAFQEKAKNAPVPRKRLTASADQVDPYVCRR